MPRNYKRKTERGKTQPEVMCAIEDVLMGQSIRSVGAKYGICHVTLLRYVKKKRSQGNSDTLSVGYIPNRQIFSEKQESELERYLMFSSNIYFGLSPYDVRLLAYQCAKRFNISTPSSWDENGVAGLTSLRDF